MKKASKFLKAYTSFQLLKLYLVTLYGFTYLVPDSYALKICKYILSFKTLAKKYVEDMNYNPDIIE